MKLILCARTTKREGWMTLDACPHYEPNFVATIPPLPKEVTFWKWEEIELVHGITSFYPWNANLLLQQIKAVLLPGGKLILEQPDFYKANRSLDALFGDPTWCDPLHMNKWAYTPASLTAALRDAGYTDIRVLPAQFHDLSRDFRIEAM